MPTAPPRPCVRPRCPHLQPCPVHSARQRPSSTERRQREPGKRLYDQRAWRDASRSHLAQHPFCEDCKAEGVVRLATQVDHVIPHKGDVATFWSSPRRSLCDTHHGRKTRREQQA